MNIGKVEPKYVDFMSPLYETLSDRALACIYGAIALYGPQKENLEDLKEYVLIEAKHIGE